jgi:tetratricopeptide (TPR) repeat protein
LLLLALGLVAAASTTVAASPAPHAPTGALARFRARAARYRLAILVAVALAVLIGVLGGWGTRLAVGSLLNFGSIEVNRALVSEETTREERQRYLDQALWILRAAAALDETNPSIQRNLALALAAKDDNRRARQAADRARDLTDPSDTRAMFQVGRTYVALGAWGEAIRAWEAAGAGPQLLLLGNRLLRARNWDQAAVAFEAAALADPESRSAYEGIVRAVRGSEDAPDEVEQRFQRLIRASEANAYYARLELARHYRDQSSLVRALAEVRRAGQIRVDADHALLEGTIFVRLGRFSEAESLLERATAALREQVGRVRDDPLQPNTSPSALGPDGLDAYYWLASVYARLGKHEQTVATVREALEHSDGARRAQRAALLSVLGDSLLALGRTDEAREAVAEGFEALPDDPHLLDTRARIAAVLDGAPRNFVANPGFEWSGAWRLVPEGDPGESDLLATEPSAVGGHAARIAAGPAANRYAAQLVTGLQPASTYRLRARVRTQNVAEGHAVLRIVGSGQPAPNGGRAVSTWAQAETNRPDWSALDLTFVARGTSASVDIGFPEGAERGAVAWFDEVTLDEVTLAMQ